MPRPILLLLVAVFLMTGLAASFLNQAGAHTTANEVPNTRQDALGTVVERCVLQPTRVRHPDHGAPILVLRPTC